MEKKRTVLALGYFDGIHRGHAALMEKVKERAEELGAVPAVLTFDNHPDTFVKGTPIELINSPEDRVYTIRTYHGIEHVFFLHFNAVTMRMPWREFIQKTVETYGAVHFVVGHDFRFGFKGEGTAEILRDYCREHGMGCDIIPAVTMDGLVISSTYIRFLLEQGDMKRANAFLGHPYLLSDTVRSGFRIGHTIDAPTINMRLGEHVLSPRHGVYATRVLLPDGAHPAVTNIGMRPTFDGENLTVETNILDYDGDLYGQRVVVEFYAFLRPEIRFDSAEALSRQIQTDAARAREILSRVQ